MCVVRSQLIETFRAGMSAIDVVDYERICGPRWPYSTFAEGSRRPETLALHVCWVGRPARPSLCHRGGALQGPGDPRPNHGGFAPWALPRARKDPAPVKIVV